MQKEILISMTAVMLIACGSKKGDESNVEELTTMQTEMKFNSDSAYNYIEKQVAFGPRVPNTEAHKKTAQWLASTLQSHGAEVAVIPSQLTAFDGTKLNAQNIIGQYNPQEADRTLFVAHWDTRPWADADPDESNHKKPINGANDGASGVGVLLEMARQFSIKNPGKGVDILFVDAEDYGDEGDEDSWALGTQHFVENPFKEGYYPSRVILLDMVGGENATFCREYFSQQADPNLCQEIWNVAAASGFSNYFPNKMGGAITDDHVQFIKKGIPAIDIIDYRSQGEGGFHPAWHTMGDNMTIISKQTLEAVGQTLINYIYR